MLIFLSGFQSGKVIEIWDYAKTGNLVIITKDKDFRLKQIMSDFPPKVVHIKFGNLKLKEFGKIINVC